MALKDIASKVFHFPAALLSGLSGFLFGSYQKFENGDYITDKNGKALTNPGLFGYLAMGFTATFRAVSNFVSNHETAIATAFWASLVVAGAAALTLALWPAALAAVAGFSVFGLSIAALVGTGVVAQVGVAAALAAAATSVAVYAGAAVVNSFIAVKNWIGNRNNKGDDTSIKIKSASEFDEVQDAPSSLRKLVEDSPKAPRTDASVDASASAHHASPLATAKADAKDTAPKADATVTSTL